MVEPVSTIVVVGAIKALSTGQPLTLDTWFSAANSMLESLLDRQSSTAAALDRIEKKLDLLIQQQYEVPFGAGRDFLGLAQRAVARAADGQNRQSDRDAARADLVKARDKFIEALRSADIQPQKAAARAIVNWHLAMVYSMLECPEECFSSLRDALADANYARAPAQWPKATALLSARYFGRKRTKAKMSAEVEHIREFWKLAEDIEEILYEFKELPPGHRLA